MQVNEFTDVNFYDRRWDVVKITQCGVFATGRRVREFMS